MIYQSLTAILIITLFTHSAADSCRCVASIEPRDPVCCDGEDFANYCAACNAGGFTNRDTDCTDGACSSCRCIASTEPTEPVCCDGEYEYDNLCAACNEGGFTNANRDCKRGSCDCLSDCEGKKEDPVCCEDTTYINKCEARCVYSLIGYPFNCNNGACDDDDVSMAIDAVVIVDEEHLHDTGAIFEAKVPIAPSTGYLKGNNMYLYMVFGVLSVCFVIMKCYGVYGTKNKEYERVVASRSGYGAVSLP